MHPAEDSPWAKSFTPAKIKNSLAKVSVPVSRVFCVLQFDLNNVDCISFSLASNLKPFTRKMLENPKVRHEMGQEVESDQVVKMTALDKRNMMS